MGPRFNGVEDAAEKARDKAESVASMGPRFNGVEDLRYAPGNTICLVASMGPRFNGVEDLLLLGISSDRHTRFNGATL